MTKDEALRLALEALESTGENDGYHGIDQYFDNVLVDKAITALRLAIDVENITSKATYKEQLQKKDEPVAWGVFEGNLHDMFFTKEEAQEMAKLKGSHAEIRPLYTTQQRTWVGLKDDDEIPWDGVDAKSFAKAIEAKLKERNT